MEAQGSGPEFPALYSVTTPAPPRACIPAACRTTLYKLLPQPQCIHVSSVSSPQEHVLTSPPNCHHANLLSPEVTMSPCSQFPSQTQVIVRPAILSTQVTPKIQPLESLPLHPSPSPSHMVCLGLLPWSLPGLPASNPMPLQATLLTLLGYLFLNLGCFSYPQELAIAPHCLWSPRPFSILCLPPPTLTAFPPFPKFPVLFYSSPSVSMLFSQPGFPFPQPVIVSSLTIYANRISCLGKAHNKYL